MADGIGYRWAGTVTMVETSGSFRGRGLGDWRMMGTGSEVDLSGLDIVVFVFVGVAVFVGC
jgi:hypothetical protein